MSRVTCYFDGFNFYNGLRDHAKDAPQWKNYYWLDFTKFCRQFFDADQDVTVKYFTAPPSDNGKRSRQSALFAANLLLNGERFETINGQYQNKNIQCRSCKKIFDHPEEKRTDVNISVNMMLDCFFDKVDTLVLISADSDQVPTLQAIKQHFPDKKVKVYFPPSRRSSELLAIAKNVVFLENNEDKFNASIMPTTVEALNKKYSRPLNWKTP